MSFWPGARSRVTGMAQAGLSLAGRFDPASRRSRLVGPSLAVVVHIRPSPTCFDIRLAVRFLLALACFLAIEQAQALKLDVEVEGLKGKYEENVLGLLGIYQERNDKGLTPLRVDALHQRAPEQIRTALAPFGLYRVQVKDSLTKPATADGTWVATYKVTPGEPVRVGTVDYQITGPGANDSAFPKQFPMKVGDVLLHSEYDKAKDEIRNIAAAQGYLDADLIRHRVVVDMDGYTAIIQFHLATGHRYYLGDVTFNQDLLADRYLEKFVDFKPGDLYDPEKLLVLQGRLIGMDYFNKVEVVPHQDEAGADRTVPIEVIATPNKANKYRFGLGYATDVGPRVTLEWDRRYLTRWGHKLKVKANISQDIQLLRGEYRIPVGNPVQDYITIRPEWNAYNTASKQGSALILPIAYSVVTPGGWRRTMGIDYRNETYEVASEGKQTVNELVPNINWSKTVTDDPLYTTNGYRIKYSLLGAIEGIISPASYLSTTLRFKGIKSFLKDYRFVTRADLGATLANSVYDLPASRRFFAGGDNSIRGWAWDVLGPNDPVTNEAVGGRYLAVGSLELERRIIGNWSAAVFTDFGNAFDPDFTNDVEVSAGVGVHYRTPIGLVRVDVAFALTKQNDSARLHIVLGPDL